MGDIRADDYVFLPMDEATAPSGGTFFQHYVDAWWVVHPERGLAFYNPMGTRGRRRHGRLGSPQCNTSEKISRMVGAKTAAVVFPEIRIEQIPSVWVPIDPNDYART